MQYLQLIDEKNGISRIENIEDFETLHVEGLCTVIFIHAEEREVYVLNDSIKAAKPKVFCSNNKMSISCKNISEKTLMAGLSASLSISSTGSTVITRAKRDRVVIKGIDKNHPFACLHNLEELDSTLPVFVIKKPFLKRLLTFDQTAVSLYDLNQGMLLIESSHQSSVKAEGSVHQLVSVYAKHQSSVKTHKLIQPQIGYANCIQQASIRIGATHKAQLKAFDQSSIKFHGEKSIADYKAMHQSSIKFK